MKITNKKEASDLLALHVKNDYQILHANMVAKALEAYAKKYNQDEFLWFQTGLLHDLDYFEYPDEHPKKSLEWFKEWGYSDELIHAVEAHALNFNGFTTEPNTKLAAALMACDELCGLIHAYTLMNPNGYKDLKLSSIKKRMKDKSFAAKINREDIIYGVDKLGESLDDHISFLIEVFAEK